MFMKIAQSLVVLDLETTGAWIEKDKIIEIAMIKCRPDGTSEEYCKRVNPGIPIPENITQLTGISNNDVKDAPLFKLIAQEVLDFIDDSNLAGFNVERFDLPLLARELDEAGLTFHWKNHKTYDAQQVFHYHEKRDLTTAYKFYCRKDLQNAHSALADTQATLDILKEQAGLYCGGTLDGLQAFHYAKSDEFLDEERKFRWWNGEIYMMFGKYARKFSLKEIVQRDRGYLEWILSADFSPEAKELVKKALIGIFPKQEKAVAAAVESDEKE